MEGLFLDFFTQVRAPEVYFLCLPLSRVVKREATGYLDSAESFWEKCTSIFAYVLEFSFL